MKIPIREGAYMFRKKDNLAHHAPQKTYGFTLVSAKYFFAMIPAEYKQNQILININQTLSLLHKDNPAANSPTFWKSKPHTPLLDDMSRLAHLVNLKMYIIQAKGIESFRSNERVIKGLDELFAQVENGINKIDRELKQSATHKSISHK
jgi:hypothetical protein